MTDLVDLIVAHLEADTWTPTERRKAIAAHTKLRVDDCEARAKKSLGYVELMTKAEWLAKVEALRVDAMVERGADESKPAHATAARCLELVGKAMGFLGAEKAKPADAPADQDERAVWRESLQHCPADVLAEYLNSQRQERH